MRPDGRHGMTLATTVIHRPDEAKFAVKLLILAVAPQKRKNCRLIYEIIAYEKSTLLPSGLAV